MRMKITPMIKTPQEEPEGTITTRRFDPNP